MQFISVLGSTVIGQQTLDVVAHHPEHFRILAIAALNEVELLCGKYIAIPPMWWYMTNQVSTIKRTYP